DTLPITSLYEAMIPSGSLSPDRLSVCGNGEGQSDGMGDSDSLSGGPELGDLGCGSSPEFATSAPAAESATGASCDGSPVTTNNTLPLTPVNDSAATNALNSSAEATGSVHLGNLVGEKGPTVTVTSGSGTSDLALQR